MVSVTLKPLFRAATAGGFDTDVVTRSGRVTRIGVIEGRQLFDSSVSVTTAASSAHARRWYWPSVIDDGMVTVSVDPVDEMPGPRLGVDRVPVSTVSSLPFCWSAER